MKTRRVQSKEVVTIVEFVFYKGDGFPHAPRLHNRSLIVNEWSCVFERAMLTAMFYGDVASSRVGGKRIALTGLVGRGV